MTLAFQSIISLLCCLAFNRVVAQTVSDTANPVPYQLFWNNLYNNSFNNEKYIKDALLLPFVYANPSIIPWIWDDDPLHPNVLISCCGLSYACPYIVMSMGSNASDWKIVKNKDNFETFLEHGGMGRQPFLVMDIRLYMVGDIMRMTYCTDEGPIQKFHYAQVFYDKHLDALYIIRPPSTANIEHEVGVRSQKSWSPFIYDFNNNPRLIDNKMTQSSGLENMFIYSVNPHRIVHGNESIRTGEVKFHTIASTEAIIPEDQLLWNYGEPRGGTPCLLINTIHGLKYITIFHSQGKFAMPYIKTYYMGGYLFNPEPPFEITHITTKPIIPKILYEEKYGWAYKAIDYIVFPTGLIIKDDLMYMTVGRDDRSGYVVIMNTTESVSTLHPIRTKVLIDKFYKHWSYSSTVGSMHSSSHTY